MIDALSSISDLILSQMRSIFDSYTTSSVLAGFFALWILDRLLRFFDILKR